jgi:hypothetical protein
MKFYSRVSIVTYVLMFQAAAWATVTGAVSSTVMDLRAAASLGAAIITNIGQAKVL